MKNPFFKNKGPFKIEKLLNHLQINNINNYNDIKIFDVKDHNLRKEDILFHMRESGRIWPNEDGTTQKSWGRFCQRKYLIRSHHKSSLPCDTC